MTGIATVLSHGWLPGAPGGGGGKRRRRQQGLRCWSCRAADKLQAVLSMQAATQKGARRGQQAGLLDGGRLGQRRSKCSTDRIRIEGAEAKERAERPKRAPCKACQRGHRPC